MGVRSVRSDLSCLEDCSWPLITVFPFGDLTSTIDLPFEDLITFPDGKASVFSRSSYFSFDDDETIVFYAS